MRSPKEAIEAQAIADRDLQSQRRLRIAEEKLRVETAKLAASEKELADMRKRLGLIDAIRGSKPQKTWSFPKRKKDSEATVIVALSDFHCEQSIKSGRVCGLNEYSLDVAESRMKNVFNRTAMLIEDARHMASIDSMVVWLGGDIIHGSLRDEALSENTLHPLEACRWACDRIESGLKSLIESSGMKRVMVATSHGNHGRSTIKMPSSTAAQTSYEHNMYIELRRRFGPEINWQIAEGYFNFVDVYDFPIRCHHGERIKFGGGINGVGVPAYRFISNANTKKRAYLDLFGHFHCFGWPGCFVSNGSLVGVDEYSQAMSGDSEPKQSFIVIDRNRGITRALPIFAR